MESREKVPVSVSASGALWSLFIGPVLSSSVSVVWIFLLFRGVKRADKAGFSAEEFAAVLYKYATIMAADGYKLKNELLLTGSYLLRIEFIPVILQIADLQSKNALGI